MRIKVALVGNFTVDVLGLTVKPGGPPLYSGLGIFRAGGVPVLIGKRGRDYPLHRLPFEYEDASIATDRCTRFSITYEPTGRRKITLLSDAGELPPLKLKGELSGVIFNPVHAEVKPHHLNGLDLPVGLDVQGFIRDYSKGDLSYRKFSFPKREYLVIHLNEDEFEGAGYSVKELFQYGFKEVILSRDRDGFSVYYNLGEIRLKPSKIGDQETGAGDFLLGAYFTLRLSGHPVEAAASRSKELVEEFTINGIG
jgi:sugar/nucleoside kinase (ribokinase family)